MIHSLLRPQAVALTIALLIICAGCTKSDPVALATGDGITAASHSRSSDRMIISVGQILISADRSSVELIPARSTDLHLNVVKLLEGKACADCLQLGNFGVTPTDVLHIDITLKHPYPGNNSNTGFDVRGILVTGADY
ncbi:MAG TPA: hypothetical protein ENN67_03360, partial [Firmicutes bacterium]|nr:hypothetical protein [Bacillota bacterium]